jgi:hypothetical protein
MAVIQFLEKELENMPIKISVKEVEFNQGCYHDDKNMKIVLELIHHKHNATHKPYVVYGKIAELTKGKITEIGISLPPEDDPPNKKTTEFINAFEAQSVSAFNALEREMTEKALQAHNLPLHRKLETLLKRDVVYKWAIRKN